MKGELFYNYHSLGDVLLVLINNDKPTTRIEKNGDIVFLYNQEELIGINIFKISKSLKIKTTGKIVLPPNQLIDLINSLISYYKSDIHLDYVTSSGFRIGKIIEVKPHLKSDHLHLLEVDLKDQVLDIVCGASNVKEGMIVVVATIGTMLFNGQVIEEGELLGVKSFGMCCSPRELNMDIPYPLHHLLELDQEELVGQDFFKAKGGK